jgi:dolichol-phosphate mannosyltransferase
VSELRTTPEPRRTLTVVIPCYNERATVLQVVERVKKLPIDKFVVVVDNCSTDGTRELLRSLCCNERALLPGEPTVSGAPSIVEPRRMDGDGFFLVLQPRNIGKGKSFRTALGLANSEYVICQDADLEYNPQDIVRLVDHAKRFGSSAVFGSRLRDAARAPRGAFHVGRIALTKIFRVLYKSDITDVATCYKLMRTDVARCLQLESSGFDLDFEIPAKLMNRKIDIDELSIGYSPRRHNQGKKIRWRHGFLAVWTLLKFRVGHRDPRAPESRFSSEEQERTPPA